MSPDTPLRPSPNGDNALTDDTGIRLAAEADAAVAGALVTESEEASAAHPGGNPIGRARRAELLRHLFAPVRFETFQEFPDPRINITALTMEAFTHVLPTLADDVSDKEAFEEVMDEVMLLAACDRTYVESRRGYAAIHLLSLVVLYGAAHEDATDEFPSWLRAVDALPHKERTVYQLIAFHGWTNAKVATTVGISEGWASKLMSRAEIRLTSAGVSVEELRGFFDMEISGRLKNECSI